MSVPEDIESTFGRELQAAERIIEIIERATAARFDGTKMSGTPEQLMRQEIALMFLAKGQKTLQAILLGFRNGFEQDAEMLGRSLIEAGTNLLWIAENPDDRFEKWAEYEGKRRMALIEHARTAMPEAFTEIGQEKIEEARAVRDAYEKRAASDRFPRDLPNRLRQTKMAAETRESLYLAYSMATDLVHTNPNCRTHYVKHKTDRVHFDSGPAAPGDPRILGPAVFSYLMLAEAFTKIGDVPLSVEV